MFPLLFFVFFYKPAEVFLLGVRLTGQAGGGAFAGHRLPLLAAGLHQLADAGRANAQHGLPRLPHPGDHHVSDR